MGRAGLRQYFLLLCQAGALLQTFLTATWTATWYLPIALVTAVLRQLLPGCDGSCDGSARFYEVTEAGRPTARVTKTPPLPPSSPATALCLCRLQGTVMHSRKQPKQHKFRCAVGPSCGVEPRCCQPPNAARACTPQSAGGWPVAAFRSGAPPPGRVAHAATGYAWRWWTLTTPPAGGGAPRATT